MAPKHRYQLTEQDRAVAQSRGGDTKVWLDTFQLCDGHANYDAMLAELEKMAKCWEKFFPGQPATVGLYARREDTLRMAIYLPSISSTVENRNRWDQFRQFCTTINPSRKPAFCLPGIVEETGLRFVLVDGSDLPRMVDAYNVVARGFLNAVGTHIPADMLQMQAPQARGLA